jgi:hypothetical protein
MSKQVVNPWYDSNNRTMSPYYAVDKPIFTIGDYAVYKYTGGYLYTYKHTAINHLVGLNKAHLAALASNTRPADPQQAFLFDRAMVAIAKGGGIK